METNNNFAVFILSHGRPDNVYTVGALKKCGYTGPVYILVDNEDKQIDQYKTKYGDKVIVFDKAAIAKTFDEGDNFDDRRAVIYARNASFKVAKELGYKYFLQLDDDYTSFNYKTNGELQITDKEPLVKDLDRLFSLMLEYYKSTPAKAIAFAQSGDFMGGTRSTMFESLNRRRKCMNTFFCSTDREFKFVGRVNEDVNTYTWYQSIGNLFLTIPYIIVHQKQTQANAGGMSEMYIDSGTYLKSFYSVMYHPSSVFISMMGLSNQRLHHRVRWAQTVPCIISEDYKMPKMQHA